MNDYKKKVCHLSSVHFLRDTRIFYKECRSLAVAGFETHLVTRHDADEIIDGVHVHGVPFREGRLARILKTTRDVYRRAAEIDAPLYHFHDPELIPVGILLKLRGRKVVYDVHEDNSGLVAVKHWIPGFLKKVLTVGLSIFERVSAWCFDAVVTVVETLEHKYPESKTILVKNYPSLRYIDDIEPVDIEPEKPVVIYAGMLMRYRGIEDVINAAEILDGKAEFWIIGRWESDEFEYDCKNLPGWNHVRFFGERPLDFVYSCMKRADIGLHCMRKRKTYVPGIPTKLFEYLACGVAPVVSYDPMRVRLWGDMIISNEPENPEDIADKIASLLNDPDKKNQLIKNGREFIEKHNWECEFEKMLSLYDKILST